jgi:cell wall-associated NlpC family hydrolase
MTTKVATAAFAALVALASLGAPRAHASGAAPADRVAPKPPTEVTSATHTSAATETTSVQVMAPAVNVSTDTTGQGQALVGTARRYVGHRYATIGNTPSEGFSCVGFTQWVYGLNGIQIPEYLQGQYSLGRAVGRSELRPGDLVFYQNTGWAGLSHVGLYAGNGQMIDAGNFETGVHWSSLSDPYWTSRWYGARRLVD